MKSKIINTNLKSSTEITSSMIEDLLDKTDHQYPNVQIRSYHNAVEWAKKFLENHKGDNPEILPELFFKELPNLIIESFVKEALIIKKTKKMKIQLTQKELREYFKSPTKKQEEIIQEYSQISEAYFKWRLTLTDSEDLDSQPYYDFLKYKTRILQNFIEGPLLQLAYHDRNIGEQLGNLFYNYIRDHYRGDFDDTLNEKEYILSSANTLHNDALMGILIISHKKQSSISLAKEYIIKQLQNNKSISLQGYLQFLNY